MYAVVRTGGKQYRVTEGQRLDVERIGEPDSSVDLDPVLIVDGKTVLATPQDLAQASVSAKVVADTKGPKIRGYKYKNKSNQRTHWGHRQRLSTIEIDKIRKG